MPFEEALKRFSDFAVGLEVEGMKVHQVSLALDERLDGDPVTRVLLLVDDPKKQTWDLDSVTALRTALARFATEIGLPTVSISLVPEAEADSVPSFAVR
jgi:hypothetical protein